MSETSSPSPFRPSPFSRAHVVAGRLCGRGPAFHAWDDAALLPGRRTFGWPLMALQAQRDLGPVRHALAQRVVAGTMTIHPPILIQAPPAPDSSGQVEHPPSVGAR